VNEGYVLEQSVVFCLCINFYFDCTTQIMNAFRECSGKFGTGRMLQLIGGLLNILLSIVLGKVWGLAGVFAATIICKGMITVGPFVFCVGRDVFDNKGITLLLNYYMNMVIMLFIILVLWITASHFHLKGVVDFIIECFMSITIPAIMICVIFGKKLQLRELLNKFKLFKR
jgi:hypothetical protein